MARVEPEQRDNVAPQEHPGPQGLTVRLAQMESLEPVALRALLGRLEPLAPQDQQGPRVLTVSQDPQAFLEPQEREDQREPPAELDQRDL